MSTYTRVIISKTSTLLPGACIAFSLSTLELSAQTTPTNTPTSEVATTPSVAQASPPATSVGESPAPNGRRKEHKHHRGYRWIGLLGLLGLLGLAGLRRRRDIRDVAV